MAIKTYAASVRPVSTSFTEATDALAAGLAQLETDIAAAQAIGAADASAEIDAVDTTFQTLVDPTAAGAVVISVDTSTITTRTQLRLVFEQLLEHLKGTSEFTP